MITTLNKIREHRPCEGGWKKLLEHLGKTKADDEPLSITTILDSNGLDDAIWCLRAVQGRDREIRLFAVWCARQVQHFMKDERSIAALDVAERFANGEATHKELAATRYAARYAAWGAAWGAASAAAGAATWATFWDAAIAAAGAARDASVAAWYAVWGADRMAAAEAAARAAQEKELRRICAEI